jgi:adenosylcobinamide-phosphate synthase
MYAFLAGRRVTDAYNVWRRDCRKTESINAGHPMSAMAGALGVELEKPGFYRLGSPINDVSEPRTLRNAMKIAVAMAITFVTLMLLLSTPIHLALH